MSKPNILFICTDQQRSDCLGVENNPVLLTPNMDEIAYNGVRFTNAYSSCPSCIAARRSMMLGQGQSKHGVVGYAEGVEMTDPTLPQVLSDHGYQTALIGRSMHQWPPQEKYGYEEFVVCDHRFEGDHYLNWMEKNSPEDCGGMFGGGVMHNDWTARDWHLPDYMHNTSWTVTEALKFLERRDADRPFFLTMSFVAPHPPLQPPAFYLNRYLRTGVPDPFVGDWVDYKGPEFERDSVAPNNVKLEGEALLSARAGYYGLINHVDDQIRRVLNSVTGLKHKELVIVFTSDHGEMLGDHNMWRKSRAYESSAGIPFIISAPKEYGLEKATTSDAVVTHADIMPTLLDMVGADIPDTVEGHSLLPVLQKKESQVRDFLHIEHSPFHHALTDGREKYIWDPKDGSEQFFDLVNDSKECFNLINNADCQDKITEWRNRLIKELDGRSDGFSDGEKLISGKPYGAVLDI
ncbi:MAG: arylsulfatase [Planctomycetota bacterium]|jgi:arylsulfatase A-like enzyme